MLEAPSEPIALALRYDPPITARESGKCLLLSLVERGRHAFSGEHVQVQAGAERSSFAADHDHPGLVPRDCAHDLEQVVDPGHVKGVELVRTVQHDLGDILVPAQDHAAIGRRHLTGVDRPAHVAIPRAATCAKPSGAAAVSSVIDAMTWRYVVLEMCAL